ncbi:MAG: hypothetical protein AB1631_10080 [Acidobacteriota bacterium]
MNVETEWLIDNQGCQDEGLRNIDRLKEICDSGLRSAGIPFLAFRQALAGSSTGPHIHIGYPSKRFAR